MTDSLVARLREAIDETQRIAQAVRADGWHEDVAKAEGWNEYNEGVREHILRHDPAAVLRRCAADRKLLDWLVMCEDRALDNNWWSLDVNAAIGMLAEAYGIEA